MCNLLGAVQLSLNLLEGSLRIVHLLVDLLVEAEVIPDKFTIAAQLNVLLGLAIHTIMHVLGVRKDAILLGIVQRHFSYLNL